MPDINKKEAARKILLELGWSKDAIKAALDPSPDQAKERAFMPVAGVNPEQHGAIQWLRNHGWGSHDISLAVPVTEAEIARVLHLGHGEGGPKEKMPA